MSGAILTTTIVALALLAPVIGRYSPVAQDLLHPLAGPSGAHWLGTDELGRDVWSRLLYAGRTDLQVGVLAVLFPFAFGVSIGTVCGYFGGRIDSVVMRIVDVVLAFPFYVLIIALVFVVGGRYARDLHSLRADRLGHIRPDHAKRDDGRP
jgi:peptide/nickel transport system permease protein